MNPLRATDRKSMENFTLGTSFPEFAIDNGDTKSEFAQKLDGLEITSNSPKILSLNKDIADNCISSDLKGAAKESSHGQISIDINSGWMDSGKFTSEFIMEKGEQEIETKMVMKLTGGNLERKFERKKVTPDLKEQNFKILQTSGIFKKLKRDVYFCR